MKAKKIKILNLTFKFILTILTLLIFNNNKIFCNKDIYDIALSKAFLKTNFIKNVYLYAPKTDPLRILIRSLWHIFYNQESDEPTPTIKGPIFILTPEAFIKIVAFTKENIQDPELINKFISKLNCEQNIINLYIQYLPKEIQDAKKILEYMQNEKINLSKKLEGNINLIKAENEKLKKLEAKFNKSIEDSKREKARKIQEVNQKYAKKSPEKDIAISKILQELNSKYDITSFKNQKNNITLNINFLKNEQENIERGIKNIENEIENKISQISKNNNLLTNQALIYQEVYSTIEQLIAKIGNLKNSSLYPENITHAILLAFYESKFGLLNPIEFNASNSNSISQTNSSKINFTQINPQKINLAQENFTQENFEKKLKFLNPKELILELSKNFEQNFNMAINATKKISTPPQVKMGRFVCELKNNHEKDNEQGNTHNHAYNGEQITEKYSDCFEAAMLDLISILFYNPATKSYSPDMLPKIELSNLCFKKFIKILRITQLAKNNNLQEYDYCKQIGFEKITCLKKLKHKLSEIGISKNQINNFDITNINPIIITDPIVRQCWINLTAGLENICYNQENFKCEIRPFTNNFINLLNFVFGANAKKIEDFGSIFSFENKDKNIKHNLNFELKDGDRPVINITIEHQENGQKIEYSIIITLMKHHTTLELKERETQNDKSFAKIACLLSNECALKNKVVHQDSENFAQHNFAAHNLLPFITIFSGINTLKKLDLSNKNSLQFARLNYYCQNMKNQKNKLVIAKHILKFFKNNPVQDYPSQDNPEQDYPEQNDFEQNNDLKKLFWKLQDNITKDPQLEHKLISSIIKNGIYKSDASLKDYLAKNATKALAVLCNINIHKFGPENLKTNRETAVNLCEFLLQSGADINSKIEPNGYTLLQYAIKNNFIDLTKKLILDKKIDINKSGPEGKTALHIAAQYGKLDIIKLLLNHKEIELNPIDKKNNTPLNLAIENNRFETTKFLIDKLAIPTLITPIHSACKRNNEKILQFLLKNPKTCVITPDFNGNMPIHIAAFYGHPNLINILSKIPGTDINKPGYKNRTALNIAVKNNKLEAAKFLLSTSNIDPNICDLGLYSPLNRAVKKGYLAIVKELLAHPETDINLSDRWGYSPIFWTLKIDVLRALLNSNTHKININHRDKRQKTILYWAASKGWTPIVRELLKQRNINPDIPNFLGKTPLSVADFKSQNGPAKMREKYLEIAKLIKWHKL